MAEALTDEIQADIEHGRIDDRHLDLLRRFARAKILTDVAIEGRKRSLNPVEGYEAEDRCRNPKCRADAKTDFRELGRAASDPKVSSLVWFNCQFGLPAHDLGATLGCVTALSPRPYCRPGMKIVADRRDIDRCLDEIHQRHRRQ